MEQTCYQKTTLPTAKVHNTTIYCVNFIHIHVHSRIESSVTNLDHTSHKAILWATSGTFFSNPLEWVYMPRIANNALLGVGVMVSIEQH